MSGLTLPPAQPPAPRVDQVLEQVRVARDHRAMAFRRLVKVREYVALELGDPMVLRVMLQAREYEAQLWADEITALEERAKRMGLQP